jgi:general secretion pathway protein D
MKKLITYIILSVSLFANTCENKLFDFSNTGVSSEQTINSFLSQLVINECKMNIVYEDKEVKKELSKNLPKLHIENYSFSSFLSLLLSDNNLFYEIDGDKLRISYLKTKTFRIDYMLSNRSGSSTFKASTTETGDNNSVDSTYEFNFWDNFASNIANIINTKEDDFTSPSPIIDKNAGLVTVTATKKQLERVQKYILDLNERLHKQVIVDVKIYSVDLSSQLETGINWSKLQLSLGDTSTALQASNILGSQSIFKSSTFDISGLLNFLGTQGNVNSISNPKIATLNNQKAIISVGDTINYRYPTKVVLDTNGNPQTEYTTENKFVGILLDITPEISKDNSIILRINPTVSTFRDETQLEDEDRELPPDTTENKMSTIIKINDGYTLILGGLITKKDSFKSNGVPVLKEIPIVKYLFSYKQLISAKKELVFVITPHVIDFNKKRTIQDLGFSGIK